MKLHTSIFFPIEIIGTIAFASSGAMVAVRKKLDLFGIIVLGVITAVGGGMLRDLIIGNIPPNMFQNPVYVFAAFLTVLILFLLFRRWPFLLEKRYLESIGGGILRDIMVGETPFVLRKHIYACASISGACLHVLLLQFIPSNYAMLLGALLIIMIRILASHYRWNLPSV